MKKRGLKIEGKVIEFRKVPFLKKMEENLYVLFKRARGNYFQRIKAY